VLVMSATSSGSWRAHFFHRVHRRDADDGCLATAGFFDNAGDVLNGNKRANGVVNENEFGVVRNQLERGGYGFLTRSPPLITAPVA